MDRIQAAGTDGIAGVGVLHVALELSKAKWVLASSAGGRKTRRKSVEAGDLAGFLDEVVKAKRAMKLPVTARVVSCYEAGRDGYWIHRWLQSQGIANRVVDPSSLQVSKRARQAKTDRLDAQMLVEQLVLLESGQGRMREVRVPTSEQEDQRRLHREMERLQKERTSHGNRIRGLLAGVGVDLRPGLDLPECLLRARLWDGKEIPAGLRQELEREQARWLLATQQLQELEGLRDQQVARPRDVAEAKAHKLTRLRGVGPASAWLLTREMFGWRTFSNRREVGASAGLTGTPYDSGESRREQGIGKAGNRRVRRVMIELAWGWLRWQPLSELSLWFARRFGEAGKRGRRVGAVAVARRLLIALWRWVEQDVVPEGALLKGA